MVIQRKQTLLLLAALILMIVFPFMSVGTIASGKTALMAYDLIAPLILAIVSAVLIGVGIFMFGNLKRQMSMMWVIIVLLIATGISVVAQAGATDGLEANYTATLALDVCSIILVFVARLLMRADLRLLRSADRLR